MCAERVSERIVDTYLTYVGGGHSPPRRSYFGCLSILGGKAGMSIAYTHQAIFFLFS